MYVQVKDMYICIKKSKSTRFLALKIWALAVLKFFDVVLKRSSLKFSPKFSTESYRTGSYKRRLRVYVVKRAARLIETWEYVFWPDAKKEVNLVVNNHCILDWKYIFLDPTFIHYLIILALSEPFSRVQWGQWKYLLRADK